MQENKTALKKYLLERKLLTTSPQCANDWASQNAWRSISVASTYFGSKYGPVQYIGYFTFRTVVADCISLLKHITLGINQAGCMWFVCTVICDFLSMIHQSILLLFFKSPMKEPEIEDKNWKETENQLIRRYGIIIWKSATLTNTPAFLLSLLFSFQFSVIHSNNKILHSLQYKLPYICDPLRSPTCAMTSSQTSQELQSGSGTHLYL